MKTLRLVFEKQWIQLIAFLVLLGAISFAGNLPGFNAGSLWGISTRDWVWLAAWLAVAHQVLVWFCWRTQLHTKLITKTFGKSGFPLYATLFAFLGLARILAAILVSCSNRNTLEGNQFFMRTAAVLLLFPVVYLFYSVKKYFTFKRAMGIDHFDESYRNKPFVQQGIFKYTRNAMYTYGFFLLWIPALWNASLAGFIVAFFNQLAIWAHYFATEKPDIKRIYSEKQLKK